MNKTLITWISEEYSKLTRGESPTLGILLILTMGVVSIFILPWLFTRNIGLPSFSSTGNVGDTINGVAGPFIALIGAVVTFLAFWVQIQANNEQKKQLIKQNEDQIFFRLLDSQESRIINSSFIIKDEEIKSFQLLEKITAEFQSESIIHIRSLGARIFCDKPELANDQKFQNAFEKSLQDFSNRTLFPYHDNPYKSFVEQINRAKEEERIEVLKNYLEPLSISTKDVLWKIGFTSFYEISYEERAIIYKKIFDDVEDNFGSFLDGYLRGWESIFFFAEKSIARNNYFYYINSQLSKFEKIIIFYYLASGYPDDKFKYVLSDNNILSNLHFYSKYLIDSPNEVILEKEVSLVTSLRAQITKVDLHPMAEIVPSQLQIWVTLEHDYSSHMLEIECGSIESLSKNFEFKIDSQNEWDLSTMYERKCVVRKIKSNPLIYKFVSYV